MNMVINMNKNNTITLELTKDKVNKIKNFYIENIVPTRNEFVNFSIKTDNVSITIYNTNKAVFQGKDAIYESNIWSNEDISQIWKYNKEQIGSDEVGTGDYFGPVCVCAAYIKEKDITWLDELGVNDSKKISDAKIIEIAPQLIKKIPYSQISLAPEKYNNLVTLGFNQAKIKAILHNQVLYNLKNKIKKEKVFTIVDQFLTERKYFSYLTDQKNVVKNIHFETKAESKYPCVAAASIIARYSFLLKMDALSKSIKATIPKGAGKEVDIFASIIANDYGFDKLNGLVKLHFANTRKLTLLNKED